MVNIKKKEEYFNIRVTREDTPLNKKLVEYLYSLPKSQRGRAIRKILNVGWSTVEKKPSEMYKEEIEQLGIITGGLTEKDINTIEEVDMSSLDLSIKDEEVLSEKEEESEEDIKSKFRELEDENG